MNYRRKSETVTLWCSAIFGAVIVLLFILFTPVVSAQGNASPRTADSTEEKKAVESRQYTELLRSVFSFVEQNYVDEIDPKVLYEGAMKGLMDSLGDPYTAYLDTSLMRSLQDTTVGSFGGVGLSISKLVTSTPDRPAYVEVASPIEDTPGWKAGIQPGDLIISINGTPTPDITMEEVLAMLRGKVGESVDLVIRRGKNMEFPVTLVRAIIEVPTVKYGMIDGTIGYLRIIEFTPQTPERVQQALDFFKKEKYTGLIIDLRNNPGGLITSVVSVADKFIDNGPIVTTKSRIASENAQYAASPSKTTVPHGLPIVVLINRGSASASEILAGALKDDHLAYLVGETTFGKGSVQQVIPLRYDDGIKLTMARYYTPSDSNIDKTGIPPDREVLFPELSAEEEKAFTDLLLSSEMADYVAAHPDMTDAQITAYAESLRKTYPLELRLLKRLVVQEVSRTKTAPLFEMDYDLQLQEAVDILKTGEFAELMKNTKTIRELQEEAAGKEGAES